MNETPSTSFIRPNPKRVVIKPWRFGFRVDPGRLKLDTAYDPDQVVFVNKTAFALDLRFDSSPFVDRESRLDPGTELTLRVAADAEGFYEYAVEVSVQDTLKIEASGGSRPGIEIRR